MRLNNYIYIFMNMLFIGMLLLQAFGFVNISLIWIVAPVIFNIILKTVSFFRMAYDMCEIIEESIEARKKELDKEEDK